MQRSLTALCLVGLAAVVSGSSGNACSNPSHKSLADYPPAREFCEEHYPQPTITVTRVPEVIFTASPVFLETFECQAVKRDEAPVKDSQDALWSSLKAQPSDVLSAVCDCVNTPRTKTIAPAQTLESDREKTAPERENPQATKTSESTSDETAASEWSDWSEWVGTKESETTGTQTSTTTPSSETRSTSYDNTSSTSASPTLGTSSSTESSSTTSSSTQSTTTTTISTSSSSSSTTTTTTTTTKTTRTTTTTTTSTSTTTTPICQAPENTPSPILKDCQPGTCPRSSVGTCSTQSSEINCQQQCNLTPGCIGYNYSPVTGYCYLYGDCQCPTTCDAQRPAPVQKDCQPGFCSRREISCSLTASNLACQQQCNVTPGCIAVNYNSNNGNCVTYGDCTCPSTCAADRPSPIKKDCQPGFCNRREIGCSLSNSVTDCQTTCNNTPGCIGVNYNSNNDYCVTYGDCTCPSTCGTDRPSPVQKDCQPGFCSRREIGCSLSNSVIDCQTNCNNTPGCIGVNYNTNNDYCVTYGDCTCPSGCGSDRPSPIQKDCQPGTCSRREINCSLSNSVTDCQTNCNSVPGCIGVNYNSNNDYCVTYGDCTCPALRMKLARSEM